MPVVLSAENLEKRYGSKRALNGVSIKVDGGTVYALLGPNGAGKTTFVRIMATQLLPSAGRASILGYDVVAQASKVREHISVVPQEARPMSLMTPYEHVLTYLISRGLDISTARSRANEIIKSLNLGVYRDEICSNLSGGLRQRTLIAMAMSSQADVLVLDEPTIGLDPVARVDVWNLIREYVSSGKTILLTTHYMEEAEALSDKLAIVNQGAIVAEGTSSEIRGKLPGATHVVVVLQKPATAKGVAERIDTEVLASYGRVLKAGSAQRVLTSEAGASELANLCLRRGVEVSVRQISLEDVFISEVGQEIGGDSQTN
ncbi:MAG TPA: ABC transporter ATP-binding protein [Nitrososphaerales archaeon]|nr:ABC transporter ATP-binding protein [Nitrososphaerales archaeon]